LSLSDTGALLMEPIRICFLYWGWISANDMRNRNDAACAIHHFFTDFFPHFAHWNVMLVTIERSITVSHPFKSRIICTKKWTCVAIFVVFVFLFGFNSHHLYGYRTFAYYWGYNNSNVGYQCAYTTIESYATFHKEIYHHVNLIVSVGIPFLGIAACNASIIYTVARSRTFQNSKRSSTVGNKPARVNSMTIMLLTLSIAFVILLAPFAVWSVVLFAVGPSLSNLHYNILRILGGAITFILFVINHGSNFILYCIAGSQFRQAVLRILCRRKGDVRSDVLHSTQPAQYD
jgi:hypothetical protein